jgi:DNA polymerase III subunit epsilon
MEQNQLSARQMLEDLTFCVLDLETTGGNPESEQIIEVGMVKIEKMKLTEERSFLVNPEKPIPDFVQKLTGIKPDDVKSAPRIEEVIDEVTQFIGDSVLVAHNISFDIPFLNGILKRLNRPKVENSVLCTNIMTKYLIPEIVNTNLNFMSQLFKLKHSKAHRAIEDARATAELLLTYLKIFEEKKIWKINQLYYPRNRFEIDRVQFEVHENKLSEVTAFLKKETRPIVLTIKGDNGVILAILPIESPHGSFKDLESFLAEFKWSMITIKLLGPMTEGYVQLSQQFLKMPEPYRQKVIEFLNHQHAPIAPENPIRLEDYFLITPHLIQGQFIIYPLMNLSGHSHLIFKYPAHRKKLTQFLQNNMTRGEQQGKKSALFKEVNPLLKNYLEKMMVTKDSSFLFCHKDTVKHHTKVIFDQIEALVKAQPDKYSFPSSHY